MKYRAIVRRTAGGSVVVTVPAFPGVSVTAADEASAIGAVREAVARAIEFDVEQHADSTGGLSDLQIDVAKGRVTRGGESVALRGATLALIVALAAEPGELSREELSARLYPDTSPEQSYNALKMTVHRARAQLHHGAILTTGRGYKLAEEIAVDIRFLPQILRAIRARSVPQAIERRLPRIFEDLYAGRPAAYAAWTWFEPVERMLARVTREIGLHLGQLALRAGNPVNALDIARRLISRDLLDEAAYELAIRAHLARGSRASALMEYRAFAGRAETELGMGPSAALARLIDEG